MACSLVFALLLLAFRVNGDSHCAKKGVSSDHSCFCHPTRLDAYIECKDGQDVVSTCAEGLSWSLKMRACVNRMLSECAGQIEQKTKKAPALLCESQPSLGSDIVSFRCHPDDASLFVICPPNLIIADIRRCPADRQFSLADKQCVGGQTTDCGYALETPEAGNLIFAANITDADVEAANITSLNADSANLTTPDAANITSPVDSANVTDSDVNSANITGPHSRYYNPIPGPNSGSYGPIPVRPRPVPVFPRPIPVLPRPVPVLPRPIPALPKRPTAVCRVRYSYHQEKSDWEGARQICEMEGGQLAVITDERAQGRIASRYGKMHEFWIGATDIEREGQFRWVNGQGFTFARWYKGQPSKSYPNYEDCLIFNYRCKDTYWGDVKCHDSFPFLCERMVCRPSQRRFPGGYPGQFRGPLRNPYQFPRNQNFPGPRGLNGIARKNLPTGRGFPYNNFQRVRTPINLR